MKLNDTIIITQEIALEFGQNLPIWIHVHQIDFQYTQKVLNENLDIGEASAIAYALHSNEKHLLILDNLKARKLAKKLSLKFTGTLGILVKAKRIGILSNVTNIIDKIQQTDFRIVQRIKKEIGE